MKPRASSPVPQTPLARGFFCAAAALALGGCKPADEVTGSPAPPAPFGSLAKHSGCPKLAGVYAWPPVEGAPQGYEEGGVPVYRKYPDFFGTGAQWEGTFRIEGPGGNRKELRISSRPDTMLISKRGAWIPEADRVAWYWSRYRRIEP